MVFSKLWYCFLGPKIYRHLVMEPEKKYLTYEPIFIESMPDTVIGVIRTVFAFTRSTWLLIVPYMYMRGYFTKKGTIYLLNVAGIVTLLFCVSIALRGIGRALNPVYCKFLDIRTNRSLSPVEKREELAKFSFEFFAHDPDFDLRSPQYQDKLNDFKPTFSLPVHSSVAKTSAFSGLLNVPYDFFCDFAMRVIGRRMIYPGSLQILNSLLTDPRDEARTKLILKHPHARRLKLVTSHSDEVDAFVVDQRSHKTPNGDKLVICTEGNGGFYEVGIMNTPLESGYSVLGWNHLGFGGSSGLPWSPNEHAAIDAVYKYARIELGFKDEDIILFAWSIGGYATSWLAMNYPNVHAVVIDASFDDLVPLALARMPQFAAGLVARGIRLFMDLRVADQLKYYPGPVLFYRRTKDEIITTQMRRLSTNRGNNLALDLIEHRYPHLFEGSSDDIREYAFSFLSHPLPVDNPENVGVVASAQSEMVKFRLEEMSSKGDLFPSELGKERTQEEKQEMIEFLLKQYVTDLADVHCTPLPVSKFRVPEPI